MINLERYHQRVREARNARDSNVPLVPPGPEPIQAGGPTKSSHGSSGPTSPRSSLPEVVGGLAVLGGVAGFSAAGTAGITAVAGVILGVIVGGLALPVLKLVARLTDLP